MEEKHHELVNNAAVGPIWGCLTIIQSCLEFEHRTPRSFILMVNSRGVATTVSMTQGSQGQELHHVLPAMRCPYLKGYSVESCRHHPMDPSSRNHQMTLRECESLREAACFWKEKYDR
ncbi:hypothetical protein TNCV_872701 [Trichonephila clavipes]|nr:hypothetical protein TNCV_872701 [Trichonephila clavipes]